MKILLLALLLAVSACNIRPERILGGKKSSQSGVNQAGNLETIPLEPIDSYLSIGPYLQKEFDTIDNPKKLLRVFVLIRQENNISVNFETLKASLLPQNAALSSAIDAAQRKGASTVEIEVEVGVLKEALVRLPEAVSSIEISLGNIAIK